MSTPMKRWQRKGTVIMAAVLFGIAAFATTTRTWLNVQLPRTAVQTPDLAVSGSDAATAVTAFAVVAITAGLAASIAGPIARWIVSVILLVSGVGVAVASYTVISDPEQGAAGAIGQAIGVSGGDGTVVTLTALPWAALVCGILIALTGIWLAIASRSWKSSRRYAPAPAPAADEASAANSPGTTTAGAATPAGGSSPANPSNPSGTAAGPEPVDEIDSWDRLTRGDDPTNYR
ncbi:Trp biosynthesis-associated membrane protein [Arthrobacter sp. zg-Y1219]|uniref:Trp biosynthesis-associated membrane protein n=1 Tax=Arthrobacter sp. zg-Y1219 TaxID=3049067 RepID=UPI0024C3CFE0|nr:Trp biosynthesis-associated membrane protein [Arthrobacter sp. zg-Y1219]MDK1361154.1 Trp biosynthesis-associated membrane protein [Arthrobacter sp. zg-Y1219]